jgi:hypothetical protein
MCHTSGRVICCNLPQIRPLKFAKVRKSNFEGSQSEFRNLFLVYASAINCGSEVMQLRGKFSLKKLRTDEKSAVADMHVLVRYSF